MTTRLQVSGRVQGVGYRAAFAAQARGLKLCGWVRNRADGSVEAVVGGAPEAVEQIVVWARRGPPAAQVAGVAVEDAGEAVLVPGEFEIRATE